MANLSITGASGLKTDYFMRMFYGNDREMRNAGNARSEAKNSKVISADAQALKRAAKAIKNSVSKEDEDSLVEVSALLNTYNNMVSSTDGADDKTIRQAKKQMNDLFKKYGDQLEDMGISMQKDGSLKINKSLFEKTDMDELKELFGKDSRFVRDLSKSFSKLEGAAASYQGRMESYDLQLLMRSRLNSEKQGDEDTSPGSTIDLGV